MLLPLIVFLLVVVGTIEAAVAETTIIIGAEATSYGFCLCSLLYLIECESVVIAFVILWEILVIDLLYNPGPLFDKGCL